MKTLDINLKLNGWWIIGVCILSLLVGVFADDVYSSLSTSFNDTQKDDIKIVSLDSTKELFNLEGYDTYTNVIARADEKTIWIVNVSTANELWKSEVCEESEGEIINCSIIEETQSVTTYSIMDLTYDKESELFNNVWVTNKILAKDYEEQIARDLKNVKTRFKL